MLAGDQMLPGINIRSVIAGVHKWRRRYPYVYLNRPGIPEQPDNTSDGIASDNGIIHEDNAFPSDTFLHSGKLDPDTVKSRILSRRNERSANILVFDQTDSIWDTRFLTESKRRIHP